MTNFITISVITYNYIISIDIKKTIYFATSWKKIIVSEINLLNKYY